MLTKDTAICIRAIDYSETSQIVTFFTRTNGKLTAIAKGSKRLKSSFDGPIETFSYGQIVFSDSAKDKLAILTEFEQAPALTHLTGSLLALNCCLFAAELLNSLTEDYDPHPELFESFLQFLKDIQATNHDLTLLILFQLTLLKEVGLQPVLNACANCKTRYEIRDTRYEFYFSSTANGLICRDCEASFPDRIKLTRKAGSTLTNLKLLTDTDEKTINEIERILIYHFTEVLQKPPKMAKYILKN